MNIVTLIGRLSREPEIKYTPSQVAIARFSVALDRGKDKDGKDKGADFPSVVCFGKTAELIEKYVHKGQKIAIEGRLQTGSYEKDGKKIYTTDVVADRIEFLEKAGSTESKPVQAQPDIPQGFTQIEGEDIPF